MHLSRDVRRMDVIDAGADLVGIVEIIECLQQFHIRH